MRGEYSSFHSHQVRGQVMNILIAVDAQQGFVRLKGIVNFYFGVVAVAAKRSWRAFGVGQSNDEIVDAYQSTLDLLAGGQRYRDRGRRDIGVGCAASAT